MVSRSHESGRGGAGAQDSLRGQLPPAGQPRHQDSLGGRSKQDWVQPRHKVSVSQFYGRLSNFIGLCPTYRLSLNSSKFSDNIDIFRSSRGFMHLRISRVDDGENASFKLGDFDKKFSSIVGMVHHYTINRYSSKNLQKSFCTNRLSFQIADQGSGAHVPPDSRDGGTFIKHLIIYLI